MQYDADGRLRSRTNGTWSSEYTYDQTGLAAFKTGSNWYYLDRSLRGDITAIRNSSGALQATIRYSAYGQQHVTYESGADTTLATKLGLTYNGRDGVVNLGSDTYWMQHRFYSAGQGRFVSADPTLPVRSWPDTAYGYAGNDPIDFIDPSGLQCSAATYLGISRSDNFAQVVASFNCSNPKYRDVYLRVERKLCSVWYDWKCTEAGRRWIYNGAVLGWGDDGADTYGRWYRISPSNYVARSGRYTYRGKSRMLNDELKDLFAYCAYSHRVRAKMKVVTWTWDHESKKWTKYIYRRTSPWRTACQDA
jgi:RHS repeat-associated protein